MFIPNYTHIKFDEDTYFFKYVWRKKDVLNTLPLINPDVRSFYINFDLLEADEEDSISKKIEPKKF